MGPSTMTELIKVVMESVLTCCYAILKKELAFQIQFLTINLLEVYMCYIELMLLFKCIGYKSHYKIL